MDVPPLAGFIVPNAGQCQPRAVTPVFNPQCPSLVAAGVSWGTLEMRALAMLLCSTLAACAPPEGLSAVNPYVMPSMPAPAAATKGIAQAVSEAKLTGPIEMSDVRQTDRGPGRFMLCIRGTEPKDSRATMYYSVFFDNDDYKGSRMSVIMDDCEKQAFRPYVGATTTPSPAPPSPAPAPAERHHRARQQAS